MPLLRIVIIFFILLQSALLAEVEVTARFNPPRIALGDPSTYTVEVTERSTSSKPQMDRITTLPIPDAHGLTLRNGRTSSSQQTRLINGNAEYSVTQSLLIEATAPEVGRFQIPGYVIDYKGQRLQVPAASLEVLERSADAGPTRDELVFMKAELPDELYVGQMVALDLKLYLEESVQLSGLNSFDRSADGFTISELPDDYRESVEVVNGRRYRTLTWPLSLTPIQTGEQKIGFQFGLTARLPGQGSRDNSRRSPFGGSLFDDFFGRTERLNVFTDPMTLKVLPLPEEGQPDSFTGAIGDMAMEVSADSEESVQGEPIMLSLVLKGSGNFERISGPSFPDSDIWKYYEPEKKFEASDDLGLKGSLRFDYVFIPQSFGELAIPETRFSYFDPETREYVELIAPPIAVKVSKAAKSFTPVPGLPNTNTTERGPKLSRVLSTEEVLLTLDYRPKPARPVGYAILQSPAFIGSNIAVALALAGAAALLAIRRRNREDPTYPVRAAAKQALKEAGQASQKALRQNDAEAFYKHGQSAIRQAATVRTGRSMQSADSRELASLLPEAAAADCRSFFTAANAHRFGGLDQQELAASAQQLERILKAL